MPRKRFVRAKFGVCEARRTRPGTYKIFECYARRNWFTLTYWRNSECLGTPYHLAIRSGLCYPYSLFDANLPYQQDRVCRNEEPNTWYYAYECHIPIDLSGDEWIDLTGDGC